MSSRTLASEASNVSMTPHILCSSCWSTPPTLPHQERSYNPVMMYYRTGLSLPAAPILAFTVVSFFLLFCPSNITISFTTSILLIYNICVYKSVLQTTRCNCEAKHVHSFFQPDRSCPIWVVTSNLS